MWPPSKVEREVLTATIDGASLGLAGRDEAGANPGARAERFQ
jgi:hypothetical protein